MDKMLKHVNKLIVTTPKLYTDRKKVGNKKIIYLGKQLVSLINFIVDRIIFLLSEKTMVL